MINQDQSLKLNINLYNSYHSGLNLWTNSFFRFFAYGLLPPASLTLTLSLPSVTNYREELLILTIPLQ